MGLYAGLKHFFLAAGKEILCEFVLVACSRILKTFNMNGSHIDLKLGVAHSPLNFPSQTSIFKTLCFESFWPLHINAQSLQQMTFTKQQEAVGYSFF